MVAQAPADWTRHDSALELAAEAGLMTEWAQMLTPGNHVQGIDRHILGTHPARRQVNEYFAAWCIVHPVIAWNLPPGPRRIFAGGTVVFEFVVTEKNTKVGCVIHF
jgi:hypothetical protein